MSLARTLSRKSGKYGGPQVYLRLLPFTRYSIYGRVHYWDIRYRVAVTAAKVAGTGSHRRGTAVPAAKVAVTAAARRLSPRRWRSPPQHGGHRHDTAVAAKVAVTAAARWSPPLYTVCPNNAPYRISRESNYWSYRILIMVATLYFYPSRDTRFTV